MKVQELGSRVKCANLSCDHQTGEGHFTLVTFKGNRTTTGSEGRGVQLLVCLNCADAMRDDIHREHEEH